MGPDWVSVETHLQPGKPVYIYNSASICERINLMKKAFAQLQPQIHFAMKCNAHREVLQIMKSEGLGIDVVSGGEARAALAAGFAPEKIIFSGVAKSKDELTMAVQKGLFQINVESLEELERLGQIARTQQKTIAVGMRMNPNIRVDTHPYITTGFRENKFGISEYQLAEALQKIKSYSPWLRLQGLSSHIGSQIRDISPLVESLEVLLTLSRQLLAQGYDLKTIDMGGGLGIDYYSDDESKELQLLETLGQKVNSILGDTPLKLLMEPGRWLVARSGTLWAQVEYVKFNGYKNFIILNTGMHHLLRPALYKAHHRILPMSLSAPGTQKVYDVVGPICESSDVIGQDRWFAEPQEGDWMAIMDAGAYGMTMCSDYNMHARPQEVLI